MAQPPIARINTPGRVNDFDYQRHMVRIPKTTVILVPSCTVIKPSVLPSTFPPGQDRGLFATKAIRATKGICQADDPMADLVNDCCVDLGYPERSLTISRDNR